MPFLSPGNSPRGFTLVEALVSLGILLLIITAVLGLFYSAVNAIGVARAKITAVAIANEQIELARNLPYAQVGTTAGWPNGLLESTKSIDRNGLTFTVSTLVKYVDDPFDGDVLGTIPNKPTDTQPSDYKLAEVRVCWNHYPCPKPVAVSSSIVPGGVEEADGTGSLFIRSLDATGQAVSLAEVTVTNDSTSPLINISSTTDIDGNLLLSSLPPSENTYHIVVSKVGYNQDFTSEPGPTNPNPTRPDTSVVVGGMTSLAFFIDRVASLEIKTVDASCLPVPDISFSLRGELLDGTDPSVYRYDSTHTTNSLGSTQLSDLQWDKYTQFIDPAESFDVAGTTISQPFNILPGSNQTVYIHLYPDSENSLLVTVLESGTLIPLSDATVRLEDGFTFSEEKSTGQGAVEQIDWSGGPGQIDFIDQSKYFTQDGNLNTSQSGVVLLDTNPGVGNFSETFTDDIFADPANTTADWNTLLGLARLSNDLGLYQSPGVIQTNKLNSDTAIIQSATLSVSEALNGQQIDFELSANGGLNFEGVTPGLEHVFSATGESLLFRAILQTNDPLITPELMDFNISYNYFTYRPSGTITSSTFNLGPDSSFDSFQWLPIVQPPAAGENSLSLQIATNTDQSTWTFVGPDGTPDTFYTISGDALWPGHQGDQYLRYQIKLSTANQSVSPTLTAASIVHSSGCVPPGQAFFHSLSSGTYQITVNRPGYGEYISSLDINGDSSLPIYLNAE